MKRLVTSLVAFAMLATPLAAQNQTIRTLKACGSEAKNSFGFHKEHPATNEGNGYVGFQTEDVNAEGTFERYVLVNCATRKAVRIEVEYLLKDSRQAGSFDGDLFTQIRGLRKQSLLANESLLADWARGEGYKVSTGNLAPRGDQRGARIDCGCSLYYPGM